MTAWRLFLVSCIVVTAWGQSSVQPSNARGGAAAEAKVLWEIGKADGSAAELALSAEGFVRFNDAFPFGPVYIVGRSTPERDWPFVHPGPVDAWVGSRRHTFTILFGLRQPPAEGTCRLVVSLIDAHHTFPPKFEVDINGQRSEHQTSAGPSDTLEARPPVGVRQRFVATVPASALHAGNNTITITSIVGSWFLYDAVALETAPGAVLSPVEPTIDILGTQSAPVLLNTDGGSTLQQLDLFVHYTGEPTDAQAVVGDRPAVAVALRPGNQHVTVPAPAVETPTTMSVSLRVGDKVAAPREVTLEPVRRWTVYLLPHSHNDIGYTDVQANVERKQWSNLETAIRTARQTAGYPAGARFKWNVEVMWAVDSYLRQATPEQQEALIEAIRAGQIELDALFANELTALCRPEELIQLVEAGGRIADRCGVPLECAMISDVPGYTWGLVPVLAQAGVKYFCVGPNSSDRIGRTLAACGDKPFYWISPSGREKVLCWVAGRGYAMFHSSTLAQTGGQSVLDYLRQLEAAKYPYDIVHLRYTTGGDNGPPDPTMCDFVKKWNEVHASPRLVIATASEMFHELEKWYGDKLPEARGDFTPYWEDGAASTARELALNRATAERLVQAETLFAMLAPAAYPAEEFHAAWRNVLLFDEHTWGAWNSVSEPDAPFVKQQWQTKQAFAVEADRLASALLDRAMLDRQGGAGSGDAKAGVCVFNTCSWARTDLATYRGELPSGATTVKADDGTTSAVQRLSTGEAVFLAKNVPPFGMRRYVPTNEPAEKAGGNANADGTRLSTSALTAAIDPQSGAVMSLRVLATNTELVDPNAPVALNDYRYMLGSDAAGAQRNGAVKISVKESGPLVASQLIESAAPGCRKLMREVRIIEGLGRVDIIDTVDKIAVRAKEGVHFGFAFNVPGGVMRMNTPWAVVRPETDQLPGACKNWLTVQRWVDISNDNYGVTWATLDAPLIEIGALTADKIGSQTNPDAWIAQLAPSQTLYSWVMNNHWHTNYKADQDGPTAFRYSICVHGPYDSAAAERFGVERSQPLIAALAPLTLTPRVLFSVEPDEVIVTALKPSIDGKADVVRLYNACDRTQNARVVWHSGVARSLRLGNFAEVRGKELTGPIELPPWGSVTLQYERQ